MVNKIKRYFRKPEIEFNKPLTSADVSRLLQKRSVQKESCVFDQAWFNKHQQKLVWLVNSWLGRLIFRYRKIGHYPTNKIVKITPNSIAEFMGVKNGRIELKEHFFARNEYARKLYFVLLPVWYFMHAWDYFTVDHFKLAPQLSFGFSTLTQYPGSIGTDNPVDGQVLRDIASPGVAFSVLRSGAGTSAGSEIQGTVQLTASSDADKFQTLTRLIFCFDTSAIGATSTISAATISLWGAAKNLTLTGTAPELCIAASTPAKTNALVAADYGQTGVTSFGSVSYANFDGTNTQYTVISFNAAGIAAISKTGISQFSAKTDWDLNNNFTGTWVRYKNVTLTIDLTHWASVLRRPKLTVTYSLPVVAPTVTTQAVSSIEKTTATGNGNITDDGGATATRGMCWDTSATPTITDSHATNGTGEGAYTVAMTSLVAGTKYYVRAYATNSEGTSYGSEVNFTTLAAGPANVKSWNGVAIANIKSINGVAITDIKSINSVE